MVVERRKKEKMGLEKFYLLSHVYYSSHLEVLAFIHGLSDNKNFTPLSVRCVGFMWPKSGAMYFSFAISRIYLR